MQKQRTVYLISYDRQTGQFSALTQPGVFPCADAIVADLNAHTDRVALLRDRVLSVASAGSPSAEFVKLHIGGTDCEAVIVSAGAGENIVITLTDTPCQQTSSTDKLTGLMNRESFYSAVEQRLSEDPAGADRGDYAVIYLDFQRFKLINDLFGRREGDALLTFAADILRRNAGPDALLSRLVSDHFAIFMRTEKSGPEALMQALYSELQAFDLPFEVTFHAGIYQTNTTKLHADIMVDRATLAQSTVKGNYNIRHAYYTADMRKALLSEQEISGMMAAALTEKQFVIHLQPQYNHSTGMLVGAEALVRWYHPENGIISPAVFIPIFEKNGFITNLDLYVFEEACIFLRKCMDNKWSIVPVSVNFSRFDVFTPNFVQHLEDIRKKYDIPSKYLRIELTESVMVGGSEYINEIISKLHGCGYIVEMDDFGSGYSSLNVLKDMDLDIIKLDMKFLDPNSHSNRGGTILSSIVRMAKWLGLPVIAEGVETVEQADFLRSIGCDYIQGYLYSKPLPEDEYIKLISASRIGATVPQLTLIDTMNAFNFWDPASQETLIFSNYVGAAAIMDYQDSKLEILRVNKKYLQELGMNLSEKDLIESDPMAVMDDKNQEIYRNMLCKAIETMEEQECETWWSISSSCCGDEHFCIRSTVRVIGVSQDRYLFHAMIRNITAERLYYDSLKDSERRFKMASEQVNVYYWEYTVATKEMRPCFRCMRDLGLPALVTNYPEPAIEQGIFPPEVADMYRDWHRQIEAGVPTLEAIIPLTPDRVPFRVRYTTEFDENGYPIKAYGSAAFIVD